MSEETIFTAARRLVRDVRTDDASHGGLLSRETIRSADTLDRQVKLYEAAEKRRQAAFIARQRDGEEEIEREARIRSEENDDGA